MSFGKSNHFSKKQQYLEEPVTTAIALKHYSIPSSLRSIDFKAKGLSASAEELTLSKCPDKTSNAVVRCLLSPVALYLLFGHSLLSSKVSPPLTEQEAIYWTVSPSI